jgi:hypothetical protein
MIIKILGPLLDPKTQRERLQRLTNELNQAPQETSSSSLTSIASIISFSRATYAAKQNDEAKNLASLSEKLLDKFEAKTGEKPLRQRLELQFALLEIESIDLDFAGQVERYDQIADICKSNEEFGLEEVCLDEIANLAIRHDNDTELNHRHVRLQYILEQLEQDIPGLFRSRCYLWRAHSDGNSALMLSLFQEMDDRYPLARLSADGKEEDDPQFRKWDIPAIRLRVESVKLQLYRRLKDRSGAERTIQTIEILQQYVPPLDISKVDADDEATIEWWQRHGVGNKLTEEVILERLGTMFQSRDPDDEERRLLTTLFRSSEKQLPEGLLPSDWKSIRPPELTDIIFTTPLIQEDFEARLEALQDLFSKEALFNESGTQYLIAQLLLTRPNFPTATNEIQDSLSAQRRFIQYVDSVSNTSIKRELVQHVLNARESIIATSLQCSPDLTVEDYAELKDEADRLLQQYKASHLAKNYSRIAAVHSAKAEITLRARQTRSYFEDFQAQYREAESYRDEIRSEISALPPEQALRDKSLSRSLLMEGTKDPVLRTFDLLVNRYLQQRWIHGYDSDKYAFEIWDQIQTRKSRALNDLMSSNNHFPSQLLDTIRKTPHVKDLYDNWRMQLGELSDKKISNLSSPSAVDAARRKLAEHEELMKKNQLLLPVLEFMKGKAATSASMADLFKGCSEGVVLVDYFIAHVSEVPRKLCIIIYRVSPKVLPPVILQLQMNIGFGVQKWMNTYLLKPNSRELLSKPAAYQDLKELYGLIDPIVKYSNPGDLLVLCPTTSWNIHRIPLHAIEVRIPMQQATQPVARAPAQRPKQVPTPLLLRNKIIYTNSHSLLRLGMLSRTPNLAAKDVSSNWKATFFSPLESSPGDEEDDEDDIFRQYGLDGANNARLPELTPKEKREIRVSTTALADLLESGPTGRSKPDIDDKPSYTASSEVTYNNFIQRSRGSDFIFFLGHVHPAKAPAPALSAHLLLHVPDGNEACSRAGTEPHGKSSYLSGKSILEKCTTAEGAHIVMLSCHGGVMEPGQAVDEPLGLVPAFFAAGARSVSASLWAVYVEDACEWTKRLKTAWTAAQPQARQKEKGVPRQAASPSLPPRSPAQSLIDLGSIFQQATVSLLGFRSTDNLGAWGSFVFHGYWMFPALDRDENATPKE